jgi:hypothetical protein
MKWVRRIVWLVVGLAVLLVAAFFALPWKGWVQQKLVTTIEAKGISPVTLTIDSLRSDGVRITNLSLGEPPLKLDAVTIGYDLKALRGGRIDTVTVNGLKLAASKDEKGAWQIDGIASLLQPSGENAAQQTLPLTRAALAALPLHRVQLAQSRLGITLKGMYADIPLDVALDIIGATLHAQSEKIAVAMGQDTLNIGALTLDAALDETAGEWRGTWAIKDLSLATERITLPVLQGKGELSLDAKDARLSGGFKSADGSHRAQFALNVPMGGEKPAFLTISEARMPWGEGFVGLKDAAIPLGGSKSVTLDLNVERVSMVSLLRALTDDKTTATGEVSGTVPLTIAANGAIKIGKGNLRAIAPGVISLSPDAIPGDNAQVALVREVMKNLQYSVLMLDVETGADNNLTVKLAVEGKNPDVENGRPIKLNVNLSGDLLNLLLQNMKLMTDPKTFIEQSTHE